MNNGVELIFFPEVEFGELNESRDLIQMTRGKATTKEAFKEVQKFVTNLGWDIQASEPSDKVTSLTSMCLYCIRYVYILSLYSHTFINIHI